MHTRRPGGITLSTTSESSSFTTIGGIIQWDPETREVNGKQVTQFTIVNVVKQVKIRVTVWPELEIPEGTLKKGMGVFVHGQYNQNGEYHNLSAYSIAVIPTFFVKAAAQTTQKPAAASSAPAF